MIPRLLHFVFGLEEQPEPFHFAHFAAVQAARQMVQPEETYFHCKHLPSGPLWDALAPFLTVVEVELAEEVLTADYSRGWVPSRYRYAHHADFIRLDVLIEQGGVYVDIDMILRRPLPDSLFSHRFVIGEEPPVRDEVTGEIGPSLCNAFLMAEKGSVFARAWREEMAGALNGTWSNHSGFLARRLSEEMPAEVHVEPAETFYPLASDREGLSRLLLQAPVMADSTLGVHLWAHLWWEYERRDLVQGHGGWATQAALRFARTTLAELARPYLAAADEVLFPAAKGTSRPWLYLSYDGTSGYAIASFRLQAALEGSGQPLGWIPFVEVIDERVVFAPPDLLYPYTAPGGGAESLRSREQVVVAHLVPEFFPDIRRHCEDAFLVGHTVWETDQIPRHWAPCLEVPDLLIVPSTYSAEVFAASGVTTPIEVVPHVAPDTTRPASRKFQDISEEIFVFYTIAHWDERKAVSATIEAYLKAFNRTDPVVLVVKTSPVDWRRWLDRLPRVGEEGSTAHSLARLLAAHENPAEVRLLAGELSAADLASLHKRGDCFVSLARSEGFGLGVFDAVTYGNPIVTTGYGGQLEYLGGWPYLVDYRLVPVDNPTGFPSYAPYQHWAEPDVGHGAELLRMVFSDKDAARQSAAALSLDIHEHYSPAAIAERFKAAVARHHHPEAI
jgi:glycosyltransferase involved in cell wall biosynthesis